MSSKWLFIITFLVLFSGSLSAQKTPGYMGKRLNIQVDIQTSPITSSLFDLTSLSESIIDFNPKISFHGEYSIGISHTPGISYERTNDYTIIGKAEGQKLIDAVITGNTYSVYDKIFKSNSTGSISPHGKYFLVHISYHSMNLRDNGIFFGPDIKELGTYNSYSIGWGLGKQLVIWKNLNFNLALKNSYNLAYLKYMYVKSVQGLAPEQFGYNPLNESVYRKLFADNFISITFGLGWLF